MDGIKRRVSKLEKTVHGSRKMPDTLISIYMGDDHWREREALIINRYFAENGTLDGLRFFRHWTPEPLPLPLAFREEEEP